VQLEPLVDARQVVEVVAGQLLGRVVQQEVLHADGALADPVHQRLVDLHFGQRLDVGVRGGRRAAVRVPQLVDERRDYDGAVVVEELVVVVEVEVEAGRGRAPVEAVAVDGDAAVGGGVQVVGRGGRGRAVDVSA